MAVRVTVSHPFDSGLPRDVSINVFHLDALADDAGMGAAVVAIHDFYTAIDQYLSPIHSGAETIRVVNFDLTTGEETGVALEQTGTITPGTGQGYPNEVAVCVSWQAIPSGSSTNPRFRGRSYIGPLVAAVGTAVGSSVRPSSSFIGDLTTAAETMAADLDALDCQLSVYSRADAALHHIVAGWVDNEFDTQRRRGLDPTDRTFFGAAI